MFAVALMCLQWHQVVVASRGFGAWGGGFWWCEMVVVALLVGSTGGMEWSLVKV